MGLGGRTWRAFRPGQGNASEGWLMDWHRLAGHEMLRGRLVAAGTVTRRLSNSVLKHKPGLSDLPS